MTFNFKHDEKARVKNRKQRPQAGQREEKVRERSGSGEWSGDVRSDPMTSWEEVDSGDVQCGSSRMKGRQHLYSIWCQTSQSMCGPWHQHSHIGQESKRKEGLDGMHWPHHQKFIINSIPNSPQAPEFQKPWDSWGEGLPLCSGQAETQKPRLRSMGTPRSCVSRDWTLISWPHDDHSVSRWWPEQGHPWGG